MSHYISRNSDFLFVSEPTPSSGEGSYLPPEPLIKETLDKFREAPLIGLEYIIEILRPRQEPIYKCMICKNTFDSVGIIADVVSTNHRLGYLVQYFDITKIFKAIYWLKVQYYFSR
jgi:hypothetical protein